MDKVQFQVHIDEKNWDKINENPALLAKYLGYSSEEFNIPEYFFTDYFLTDKLNKDVLIQSLLTYVIKNLKRIITNRFSTEEMWNLWFKFFTSSKAQSETQTYALVEALSNVKDFMAFRCCLNNFDEIKDIINKITRLARFLIKVEWIEALSDKELSLFFQKLHNPGSIHITFDEPEKIYHYLNNDLSKLIDYHIELNGFHNTNQMQDMIKNAPQHEIEEYIRTGEYPLKAINWYPSHPEADIPDDLVEKILKTAGISVHDERKIMNSLTKEQVKKFISMIDFASLITHKEFTLNECIEIHPTGPNGYTNYNNIRFFTEEEIAENPKMFDPVFFKVRPNVYMTRETHKILNSYHNKRQKYNEYLIDFSTILKNVGGVKLNYDVLEYLIEKCNPDNEEILRGIQGKSHETISGDFGESIRILQRFLEENEDV